MAYKVLFVCTGNSARSQMAEAFLRKLGGDRYEAYSAGRTAKGIHPYTIQVLNEVGIDISHQQSKAISAYLGHLEMDEAIIVCRRAEEECPTIAGTTRKIQRWLFDDPVRVQGTEAEKLDAFRRVRDEIHARISLWLAETAEAERVTA
jgi:arsenate reductase